MKKLMKIFLIMVVGLTVALATTQVFADDFDAQFANNTVDLTTNEQPTTPTVQNDTPANETVVNNVVNNTANNVVNNTANNTNKNSSYNNTNLPKTGIEDAIPVAILVVVCGISAVYAYKKISDYKNI